MSDLIKREDAIEAYSDIYWIDDRLNLAFREELDKIDEKIRNIPTVEIADRPQGEWIPCSERLPKKEKATYLICTETGHMCSCRWTNDMYGIGSNEWSTWGWHIMDKPQYAKVVAWMPLKPWKGEDDEGHDI